MIDLFGRRRAKMHRQALEDLARKMRERRLLTRLDLYPPIERSRYEANTTGGMFQSVFVRLPGWPMRCVPIPERVERVSFGMN